MGAPRTAGGSSLEMAGRDIQRELQRVNFGRSRDRQQIAGESFKHTPAHSEVGLLLIVQNNSIYSVRDN